MEKAKIEILLIEDNLADAELMKEMLAESRWEFSVDHVLYLADGLDLLKSRSFDVVMVDLGLPDSQGLETALTVRNQAKHAPVVVLTTLNDLDAAITSLQMDIQDYLVKGESNSEMVARSIRYAVERKRIAEALRESEERFASFMLNLPAAAWMKDLERKYFYANAETERIFSMPFSEFSGKRDEEFLPPETARQFRENDARVLAEGGNLRTTEVLRQTDGVEHHFIVSKFAVPGPNGRPANVAGVAFDITDLRRMEEELRDSDIRYRTLYNSIDEGFCIIEVIFDENEKAIDYRFLEINPSFEKQTGLVDALGKRMRELAPKHEEHWFETYGRIALTGEPARFQNLAEQLHRWYDVYAFRFGQPEKRQVAILFNDITERKRAEEKIERLNTDLTARAAELEAANLELEAFNYTVAHDLRQPLNIINSYCQVIKELCAPKLDEKCQGYLSAAYDATLRMDRLMDAHLRFSQLSHLEPHRETVDVTALASEIAADLRLTDPERRCVFRVADGITGYGDPKLLRMALGNLLGNAWKYTGEQEEAVIEFGVTEADGKPAFFVRDNGAGFDEEDAAKLFLPFQRFHGAEKFKGFGVGLASVERIIKRHGGRVWAEGAPGQGATFYFTLSAD